MSVVEFTEEDLALGAARALDDPSQAHEAGLAVAEHVARLHHVTVGELLSRDRHGRVTRPRLALYAALQRAGWSLPKIGRFVGRDHTTVLDGIRKHREREGCAA